MVGCFLDLGASPTCTATMRFSLNGKDMGVAFADIYAEHGSSSEAGFDEGFFPAFSVEDDEALVINVGQQPFRGAPEQIARFCCVQSAIDKRLQQAIVAEAPTAVYSATGAVAAVVDEPSKAAAASTEALEPAKGGQHRTPSMLVKAPAPAPARAAATPGVPEEIKLDQYSSAGELEPLGADRLRNALLFLGMKAGGTVNERAVRLFAVKGLRQEDIPPTLLAKARKKHKKNNTNK